MSHRLFLKTATAFLVIVSIWMMQKAVAQTTVFSDDFSTNQNATYTTSGAIGSSVWTAQRSGGDWGARRNTSPAQLELTNDASATGNASGWVYAYTPTSSFLYPYNSSLSSNPNVVTWNFNMRQSQGNPNGFTSGTYGDAFILGSTSSTVATSGNGYAVVLGDGSGTDPIRLVSFSGGIQSIGTTTTPYILASNTVGLTDFDVDYLSIRVTYTPSSNTWELFMRNDGLSAFADPAAGTMTSQGTATNTTYTSTSLTYMGAYWQGANNAGQAAFFDNVSVTVAGSVLSAAPTSLSYGSICTNATSTNSFVLNGAGLTGNVTVTPPTNFTVSTDNVTFGSSATVTPVSNGISAKTIYVKFAPTAATSYSGNVSISGGSATTINVAVTGTGLPLTVSNAGSDASICSGSTFTFSSDAASSYTTLSWQSSGNGTFSPNATSLHPTYNPGSLDISSGTATLTLTATGVCNTAADPMILTVSPTGQWLGTVSSDWFNAGNWCSGIPTTATDVIVNSGTPNQPVINAAGAVCRNLTLNTGAALNVTLSGALSVYGNMTLNGTGSYTDGSSTTLTFAGSSAQIVGTLTANNVVINNASGVSLSGNLTVSTTLTLSNGLVTTGSNELIVTNTSVGAISNYALTRYVNGKLRRSISGTGVYNFPVGTSAQYELLQLNLHSLVGVSNAVVSFSGTVNGTDPNLVVNGTLVNTVLDGGIWTVTPNALPSSGTYDVTLYERGFSNHAISQNAYTALKRTNSFAAWTHQGTTVSTSQNWSNHTVTVPNYGLASFSDFAIGFGTTVLPVTLSSFTVSPVSGSASLRWTTASEYDDDYFEVERSDDGVSFETLASVAGHGTTDRSHDYDFMDAKPHAVNYYRLKQNDKDGTAHYSMLRYVEFKPDAIGTGLSLYPVPAGSSLTVVGTRPNGKLLVYDLAGKLLTEQTAFGESTTIPLVNVNPGMYLLEVETAQGIVTRLFSKD